MRWPDDRVFVDKVLKINDSWFGRLKRLEPLLKFTTTDFRTLQELIQAAQEAEDNPPAEENIFLLPIEDDPLFTEDYVVGTRTSENDAGRRFPLSLFAASMPVLISTTDPLGLSTVDIAVPSGYTHAQVRVKGLSMGSSGAISVGFSENAGSTLLDQAVSLNGESGNSNSGKVSAAVAVYYPTSSIPNSANNKFWSTMFIYDYANSTTKYIEEQGIEWDQVTNAWEGVRFLSNSSAPVNQIRFVTSTGTFDAGTIELWGIP